MSTATPVRRPWAEQGKNLRNARRRTKLSQENFAPQVGTTRRHLIRLENGEHKPSSELLARISERTGQSSESFGYPSDDDDEESDAVADLAKSLQRIVRSELKRIRKGLGVGEQA